MGRMQGGIPARLQMFLLLLLNLHIVSSTTNDDDLKKCNARRTKQFQDQRAAKLFENLGLTAGLVHWPAKADITELHNHDCKSGSGISDTCINDTIGVHYYFDINGTKQGIVITDLSRALKCDSSSKKCICAEEGAEAEVIGEGDNKEKRCIKKENVDKGNECIHDMECKDKNLVCVYHPGSDNKDIANCGEIDDLRRFCGHSNIMLPTVALSFLPAIIVPVSYFTLFK